MKEPQESLIRTARQYVSGQGEFDALYLIAMHLLPALVDECPEEPAAELAKLIVHSDSRLRTGELTEPELIDRVAELLGGSPSLRASSA